MFESYVLKRQAKLMGFHLKLVLYVDLAHSECDLTFTVDGRLTDAPAPRFWEVDTPAKAESWFRKIDMDLLAERIWLERRAA